MTFPFPAPFPGPRFALMSGVSYVATYFVNGSTGSDSDSGLTDPLAFLTLAKLDTTIGTTENVLGKIKGGLTYRETLHTSTALTTIEGYDGQPILDGSSAVTGWSAEGTANVWQASVAHDTSGSNRMRVWNTAGVELTRVANVATCSSTPGSYVALDGTTASPWTVKVRPSGGDADPEGYFVSRRNDCVYLVGDGSVLRDVIAKRALSNNGAIELGTNALGERLLSIDGTKHNFLWASGTLRDCIACRADAVTGIEPSATSFVAYKLDPTGLSATMERCFAIRDGGSTSNTILTAHGTYPDVYTSLALTQCGVVDYQYPFAPNAISITLDGFHGRNLLDWAASYADNVTNRYFLVELVNANTGSALNALSTIGTWLFEHGAIQNLGGNNGVFRLRSAYNGVTLELNNLVVNFTAFGNFMTREGMSSGTIKVNNCLIVANSVVANGIAIPSGVTYEGDYNVFAGTDIYNTYQGNGATNSLATWQSQTGQDANSIKLTNAQCATIFSGDPANGDFRLNGTGSGATIAAMSAGPQYYWDWNARAATAGQPSAWPTLPTTEAEAITYISDPAAWDFYP